MYKRKYEKFIFIVAFIMLCATIPIILDLFVFGNNIKSNLNNSEWSSFLGSYIGGIFGGIATLIAVIISLNLSRKVQKESEIMENSLIVYYDFVLGLTDLKKLYINCINSSFKNIPTKLFFSNEWIKNVVRISGDVKDIDKMYKLYGDLEMIGQEIITKSDFEVLEGLEKDFNNNRYKRIITKISQNIFSREFIVSNMEEYSDDEDVELDINKDLNEDYKKIILNLKSVKDKYMN
jgi:hypothetical protein